MEFGTLHLIMSGENPPFDIETMPGPEFVARSIAQRFPNATLEVKVRSGSQIFEITLERKMLLQIDKNGMRYAFPTRRKRRSRWNANAKRIWPRIVEQALRDLAEADYEVVSSTNKPIMKKPIHISRYTRCPICKEKGGIKVILHSDDVSQEGSQIFILISRAQDINGAEVKCTLCGWMGIREQLPHKSRSRF